MRSRSLAALFRMEALELGASLAFWLMLLASGFLLGHAFITAVDLYAEASGSGGGPAALAQGLSPLDGILIPTFGAYDLAATLLLPFVCIRLVAQEKASGASKLLLQFPIQPGVRMALKATMLLIAWVLSWLPGLGAILLWKVYGGHISLPEVLNLLLGHALRAWIAIGVAMAAAAFTDGAASAAILSLAFTCGTWALEFVAAVQGGWLQTVAAFTPSSALRGFEQGLLSVPAALVVFVAGATAIALAAAWTPLGMSPSRRLLRLIPVALCGAILCLGAGNLKGSLDMSENRRHSFPPTDEALLRTIPGTLTVTVNMAAEDPRLQDLEQGVLAKLSRVMRVEVVKASKGRTGLFASHSERYGEVWYRLGKKEIMNRSTTEPIILSQIYELAGMPTPEATDSARYPGFPLVARPKGAALVFFLLWPLLLCSAFLFFRKWRSYP